MIDGVIAAVEPELPGARERDRRERPARPPGRARPARALQRARPHALGGPRDRQRGARRRRLHGVLRHAAELVAADDRRRRLRRQARGRARASSCVDFGLWGGLVPGNLDRLEELAERGVIGFKAFMSNSGIDEFAPRRRRHALRGHGDRARGSGRLVAVHAENDALTARSLGPTRARLDRLAARRRRARGDLARDRCSPRTRAARCTSCTSPAAAASRWSAEARARGVDVTCETCPHYLFLTPEDVEALGRGGQVRAAGPRRGRAGGAVGAAARDDPDGHLGPLAVARRTSRQGDVRRGLGRDRGRADRRSSCCSGARRAAARRAADRRPAPPSASGSPARAGSRSAPTPTSRSSTSTPYTLARRRPALPPPDLALRRPPAARARRPHAAARRRPRARRRPPADPRRTMPR